MCYYCKNTALAAWHPLPKFERSQYEDDGGTKEIFNQHSLMQVKHTDQVLPLSMNIKGKRLEKDI